MPLAVIVHGGAKEVPPEKEQANRAGCIHACDAAWEVLQRGGSALDAVEAAIRVFEDDPAFNAGIGSELNEDGEVQTDASLMEGKDLKAGSVGFAQHLRHPISGAKIVMEQMLVFAAGDGADKLCEQHGAEMCENRDLITEEKRQSWEEKKNAPFSGGANNTVGCVVMDREGNLACGASTGGTGNNPRGRIGDSPQLGCGLYADNGVGACANTGDGEQIARAVLAKSALDALAICDTPDEAASYALDRMVKRVGGEAGLIMIDRDGAIGWTHNSSHMPVAYRSEANGGSISFLKKAEEGG